MKHPPSLADAEERGLLTSSPGVHTFSNGSEWDSWSSRNCDACRFWCEDEAGKYCAFEAAAFLHQVSPALAQLFGWEHARTEYGELSGWDAPDRCAFFHDRSDDNSPPPPPPDPDQLVLIADPNEDAAAFVASEELVEAR